MAKDKLVEYDSVANNNTVVGDVNLQESSMLPSDVNNAIREVMSHQKEAFGSGTPLYVDQTNNRVGINKTPTVALDVSGDANLSGTLNVTGETTLATHLNMGDNDIIKLGASDDLQIYHTGSASVIKDGGTGDLYIAGSTNVKITNGDINEDMAVFTHNGAVTLNYDNSPKFATTSTGIDVTGTVTADGLTVDGSSQDVVFSHATDNKLRTNADTSRLRLFGGSSGSVGNGASLALYGVSNTGSPALADLASATGGDIRFRNGTSESMRIKNGGNVGIGTSSPDDKLHVADSSNAELKLQTDNANGGSAVKFNRNGTDNSYIGTKGYFLGNSDNNLYLRANSGLGIEFYTNGNNERMRIDSSGALFINRTSTYSYANGSLCVEGTGGNPCIVAGTSGTSFYNNVVIGNGNGNVGSISTNGSSTAYNTSSDYRLKENVVSDWDATTRLKQLNPVRFNFIADADTTVDGFLAHEVQSVVPEAISGTHNEVDADGNPVYQGIDQSKLVPLLVKTIQELEARIVALETA